MSELSVRAKRTLAKLPRVVEVNISASPDYWAELYQVIHYDGHQLMLGHVNLVNGVRVFTPNKWYGLNEILKPVEFSSGGGGFEYLRMMLVEQIELAKGGGL